MVDPLVDAEAVRAGGNEGGSDRCVVCAEDVVGFLEDAFYLASGGGSEEGAERLIEGLPVVADDCGLVIESLDVVVDICGEEGGIEGIIEDA